MFSAHDFNICGHLAWFTFEVTWHAHSVQGGTTFVFDYTEAASYSLVFDDPSLGTWYRPVLETCV